MVLWERQTIGTVQRLVVSRNKREQSADRAEEFENVSRDAVMVGTCYYIFVNSTKCPMPSEIVNHGPSVIMVPV